jgi:hypothetical protein
MHPPPRHPILGSGRRSIHLLPRIRLTLAPTPTRAVAIARPRGRFTSYVHHRFCRRQTSHSSSRPSSCSSSPSCCPRQRLQPRTDRRSSTRVRGESVMLLAFLRACHRGGHGGACHAYVILTIRSPGLRYWTTKACSMQQSVYAMKLVVVLCRFGASMARKTLAFSCTSRIDA